MNAFPFFIEKEKEPKQEYMYAEISDFEYQPPQEEKEEERVTIIQVT